MVAGRIGKGSIAFPVAAVDLVPAGIMLLEPLEIPRTHRIGAPEVERPNSRQDLANRMMRPFGVRCGLGHARRRLNAEFGQAIEIAADKIVGDPFLPLILVGPRPDRCAILRLPADQRIERLVRMPEMAFQRLVNQRYIVFVTKDGEQRTIAVCHMARLVGLDG
jgi:hypothetical protein